MAKAKTQELTDAALDYAVAVCEKNTTGNNITLHMFKEGIFKPSSYWSQGGAIVDKMKHLDFYGTSAYYYPVDNSMRAIRMEGKTKLQSAMRCYVASMLGDIVEIPDELMK